MPPADLDDDCLTHVLSFLPLKHRLSCSLVSKRWRHFARTVPSNFTEQMPERRRNISLSALKRGINAWGNAIVSVSFPRNFAQESEDVDMERELKERKIVLSRCKNIQTVKISGYVWQLDDFAQHCPNLKILHLLQPQDSEVDLHPLTSCTNLETFVIIHDPYAPRLRVHQYKALESLPKLRELWLKCRVDFVGLVHISNLTNLEVLDISLSGIDSTLEPLWTLTNLRALSCPLVHIQEDISCWPKLERISGWTLLSVEGCVDDISFLHTATNITSLTLPVTVDEETDPTPISACTELTSITIQYLWCHSLDYLSTCTKLQKIRIICGTREVDITPLENCKQLTSCLLVGVRPVFIQPLLELPYLKELSFGVADESLAESLEELTTCVSLTSIKITVMCGPVWGEDLPINIGWMCELPKLKSVALAGAFAIDKYKEEREKVREVVVGRGGKVMFELERDEENSSDGDAPEWWDEEGSYEDECASGDTEEEEEGEDGVEMEE
eukprot:comp12058_c0_seq1/m.6768 comp12058_c0_seq1/g.6768  ORF comp12058_c0_seq1/g.6768 comp12058_c0_seq1/m.6768 type:complete len:501 (-) comp12058_c0_seq1:350-1852(-)